MLELRTVEIQKMKSLFGSSAMRLPNITPFCTEWKTTRDLFIALHPLCGVYTVCVCVKNGGQTIRQIYSALKDEGRRRLRRKLENLSV